MNKAQFVSPIILLTIIIISTIIISVQTKINTELNSDVIEHGTIINTIQEVTELDLQHRNYLSELILNLSSSINSSGTIMSILSKENVTNIEFNEEIRVNYSKQYRLDNYSRIISSELIVPYPYNLMTSEELRFNSSEFKTCMGTTCSNIQTCVNAYDYGTINWEPIICLSDPLRVKISITSAEHSLTSSKPYVLWNNSLIIV